MKIGNQFYLEIQITDNNNDILDIDNVSKVQFNIDTLTKNWSEESSEVAYNHDRKSFMIWLTEEETFKFNENVRLDTRILFNDGTIIGSYIKSIKFHESLKEVILDDDNQSNE